MCNSYLLLLHTFEGNKKVLRITKKVVYLKSERAMPVATPTSHTNFVAKWMIIRFCSAHVSVCSVHCLWYAGTGCECISRTSSKKHTNKKHSSTLFLTATQKLDRVRSMIAPTIQNRSSIKYDINRAIKCPLRHSHRKPSECMSSWADHNSLCEGKI